MILLLAGLVPVSVRAAQTAQSSAQTRPTIRVTPNAQIFATLCALYAAGYPVLPSDATPQMKDMAVQLGTLQGPTVTALREFYNTHRLPTNSGTLAQYVSFAMVVGPPPSFRYIFPEEDLPPDVRALAGFQKLLADFYNEEDVEALWRQMEPSYQAQASNMVGPVSQIVTVSAGYAREMNPVFASRTFSVFVDPLVGLETNFRIYSESYEIAVDPSDSRAMDDIRLAFLHFLLDPLPFNSPAIVDSKAYLLNFAVHAPRLPADYKNDFLSLTDECLVRAVDLRLTRIPPAALEAALTENDREGYILVRPLYNGLGDYERSTSTLADYFPKLIESINLDTEGARDQNIAFLPAESEQPSPEESSADRVAQWLEEGDRQIAIQDGKGAIETFERILKVDPKNTRAEYGLAVATVLIGQAEQARQLFQQVVKSPAADPSVVAWSHVYLGRMSDLAGRRQDALAEYRAALGIAGVSPMARAAAEQGMKQPFAAQKSDPGETPQH